jgi:hypothetical protein
MTDATEEGKGKLPAFQFYPKDWREDLALQSCSLAAQGLWINALCIAHQAQPYGHLMINGRPMNAAQIARAVGVGERECRKLLAELEAAGVFSQSADGAIFSRRMVRDQVVREKRAAGGAAGAEHGVKGASHGHKGGRPRNVGGRNDPPSSNACDQARGDQKPPFNPPPSSSSSSSSSSATSVERNAPPLRSLTAKGELSLKFKAAGIFPEPGYADFVALVEAGVTWEEFEPHVARGLTAEKPFRYIVGAVAGERRRAASRGPMPPAPASRANRQQALEDANRAVGERWAQQQETTDHAPQ